MTEQEELRMLRERLGPRGLEVVFIGDVGHYVNEKIKAEIERLRAGTQWRTDFENAPSPCIGWCSPPAGDDVRQIWRHPHLKDQWSAHGVTQTVKAWQPLPIIPK